MRPEDDALYGRLAAYYDPIYHFKPYEEEARLLHGLLEGEGIPDGGRVLEAGCGTGSFLVPLRRWYRVSGFDRSAAMLQIARGKLPGTPLFRADMAHFTVDTSFDALLCLFSSIGYIHPEERLRAAARAFAASVRPGGALVIEPWLAEEAFISGHLAMQTYDGEDLKLCRAAISRKEGALSVFDFHWLVVRAGAPDMEHVVDRHTLWLCPTGTLLEAFEDAGFEVRLEPKGLMPDRGLIVGRRR